MLPRLKAWARDIKRGLLVLWLVARDPRVARPAKLLAGVAVAYALSPIDLIPDAIPVLGLLDDLLIVPLLMAAAFRLVPRDVLADLRDKAKAQEGQRLPRSALGAVVIVALWVLLAIWLFRLIA